eukprot:TRINITY_DN4423_c0_g1_i1.p1 TRINITY_DN4423_c0_g1~~TRINITY_DN4423_c0_g1_i1.p1  ORF type:complete len:884 (-),score=8.15 TRINITY_DN4423_c0_g1_i1:707-3358(-)
MSSYALATLRVGRKEFTDLFVEVNPEGLRFTHQVRRPTSIVWGAVLQVSLNDDSLSVILTPNWSFCSDFPALQPRLFALLSRDDDSLVHLTFAARIDTQNFLADAQRAASISCTQPSQLQCSQLSFSEQNRKDTCIVGVASVFQGHAVPIGTASVFQGDTIGDAIPGAPAASATIQPVIVPSSQVSDRVAEKSPKQEDCAVVDTGNASSTRLNPAVHHPLGVNAEAQISKATISDHCAVSSDKSAQVNVVRCSSVAADKHKRGTSEDLHIITYVPPTRPSKADPSTTTLKRVPPSMKRSATKRPADEATQPPGPVPRRRRRLRPRSDDERTEVSMASDAPQPADVPTLKPDPPVPAKDTVGPIEDTKQISGVDCPKAGSQLPSTQEMEEACRPAKRLDDLSARRPAHLVLKPPLVPLSGVPLSGPAAPLAPKTQALLRKLQNGIAKARAKTESSTLHVTEQKRWLGIWTSIAGQMSAITTMEELVEVKKRLLDEFASFQAAVKRSPDGKVSETADGHAGNAPQPKAASANPLCESKSNPVISQSTSQKTSRRPSARIPVPVSGGLALSPIRAMPPARAAKTKRSRSAVVPKRPGRNSSKPPVAPVCPIAPARGRSSPACPADDALGQKRQSTSSPAYWKAVDTMDTTVAHDVVIPTPSPVKRLEASMAEVERLQKDPVREDVPSGSLVQENTSDVGHLMRGSFGRPISSGDTDVCIPLGNDDDIAMLQALFLRGHQKTSTTSRQTHREVESLMMKCGQLEKSIRALDDKSSETTASLKILCRDLRSTVHEKEARLSQIERSFAANVSTVRKSIAELGEAQEKLGKLVDTRFSGYKEHASKIRSEIASLHAAAGRASHKMDEDARGSKQRMQQTLMRMIRMMEG